MEIPVISVSLTRAEIEFIEWALVNIRDPATVETLEMVESLLPDLQQALEDLDHSPAPI